MHRPNWQVSNLFLIISLLWKLQIQEFFFKALKADLDFFSTFDWHRLFQLCHYINKGSLKGPLRGSFDDNDTEFDYAYDKDKNLHSKKFSRNYADSRVLKIMS